MLYQRLCNEVVVCEVWLPVANSPGYEVSSLGRVRSLDREIVDRRGRVKRLKGKVLSPGFHDFGYPFVMLGKQRGEKVHVLVAEAFIGPRPPGMQVCHDDGVETNNVPGNLYYGTPKQNQADRRRHGTDNAGERHPLAKVTQEQIEEIRRRVANGEIQRVVGQDFGLTQPAVSLIVNKKRWNNGQG